MEIAKALVPTGRADGDRPWPVAGGPKPLFPVANRPILFHNLEALRAAGVLEPTLLVERDGAAAIGQAVGNGSEWGLAVRYAEYVPANGLSGALAAGDPFVGDEPVLVQLGDALLAGRLHEHIAAFAREGLDALVLQLERPLGHAGRWPEPALMLSPSAFSMLMASPQAAADPVAGVRAWGGHVRVQRVDGCLPCHGKQESVLDCNRRMLEGLVGDVADGQLSDCRVQGELVVHPSASVERSVLRGPAIIGPGARLSDAYVGPYTSIGADVVIEAAEIEHSIVLSGAELRFLGTRLESSVIGADSRVVRSFAVPNAMRMTVGDGADVQLA